MKDSTQTKRMKNANAKNGFKMKKNGSVANGRKGNAKSKIE